MLGGKIKNWINIPFGKRLKQKSFFLVILYGNELLQLSYENIGSVISIVITLLIYNFINCFFLGYCFCLLVTLSLAIAIGIVLLSDCYHNLIFLGLQKNRGRLTVWHVVDIDSWHVHSVATLNMTVIYNFALCVSFFIVWLSIRV